MNNLINIFSDKGINPSFVKANIELIMKNKELFSVIDKHAESHNFDMFKILEKLWHEKYRVKILKNEDKKWDGLIFQSEKDMSLFNIKWIS